MMRKAAGQWKAVLGLWGMLIALFLAIWRFLPASTAATADGQSGSLSTVAFPFVMAGAFLILAVGFIVLLVRRLRPKG
jgi:hypothetical protein